MFERPAHFGLKGRKLPHAQGVAVGHCCRASLGQHLHVSSVFPPSNMDPDDVLYELQGRNDAVKEDSYFLSLSLAHSLPPQK